MRKRLLFFALTLLMVFALTSACNEVDDEAQITEPTIAAASELTPEPSTSMPESTPAPEPIDRSAAHALVADIKIGVNLAEIHDQDNFNGTFGYDEYYSASINMAIQTGWRNDYDWLFIERRKGFVGEVSYTLPNMEGKSYDENLFTIAVFEVYGATEPITIGFENVRVEMPDGTIHLLSDMNGIKVFSRFDKPDINGHVNSFLDSYGYKADIKYQGGCVKMTVNIIDAPEELVRIENKAERWFTPNMCYWNWGKYPFIEYSVRRSNTHRFIDDLYELGHNAIRLCVTWTPHINDETFSIDKEWMDSVQETVEYILDKGMYCILNAHHDYLGSSWVGDERSKYWMMDDYKEYVDMRFTNLWTQIANRFKDYDQKLFFEAFNEPVMGWPKHDSFLSDLAYEEFQINRINELNEIFIETVRFSGGKNETRLLLIGGANCNFPDERCLDGLIIPDDEYIIVSIHCYDHDSPGGVYSKEYTDTVFNTIDSFKERNGVPVLMGEWGMTKQEPIDVRKDSILYFLNRATQSEIPCFWWEEIGLSWDDSIRHGDFTYFGFYDKLTNAWIPDEYLILQEMMRVIYPN